MNDETIDERGRRFAPPSLSVDSSFIIMNDEMIERGTVYGCEAPPLLSVVSFSIMNMEMTDGEGRGASFLASSSTIMDDEMIDRGETVLPAAPFIRRLILRHE